MQVVVNDIEDRIDKYLSTKIDESRSTIIKMINDEFILVNNQKTKPSYKVKLNDIIDIKEGFKQPENITEKNIPLDIVYEDNDIIVVNKPSGLTVHPGSGNKDNTLVNALKYYTNNLSEIGGEERPGIVHRIDKDTSGLLLIAKNNKTHNILTEYFKNKEVKREYIAIIDGIFPHDTALIDAPIGRDEINRQKMAVTAKNSKKAFTNLKVLKRYNDKTLVSLILGTGRTHQIRVHLSYIGYPVTNDPIYSHKSTGNFGQYLHSWKMDFLHPITKKPMHFEAPLPKEFNELIAKLENDMIK